MTERAKDWLPQSYLLRIWQERGEPSTLVTYRFSLIDPHTHKRHSFESLTHMVAFLEDWLCQQEQPSNHMEPS